MCRSLCAVSFANEIPKLSRILVLPGEEAAKLHGAPPIVLMRYVSTSGTMADMVSKLLVLLDAEMTRFGNNVQPVRAFIDCSTAKTGAFCFVYNKMNTEAYCNLRVRQAFTGQPNTNPIHGQPMTEINWCNTHVQHAKASWPIQHSKSKVLNATKGLQSKFMVATGQHLTHVPTFARRAMDEGERSVYLETNLLRGLWVSSSFTSLFKTP